MPLKTWVLLDQSSNQITPMPRRIGPEDVGGAARGYRVEIREHVGGLSTGVWSVVLDNGAWEVEVVPLRGMGIWKARSGSTTVGWDSPVAGPVHPAFVPLAEPSGLGWLDGFDELLVRCGLESNGAPEFDSQGRLVYPLHGRIANRPAHHVALSVDPQSGELTLTGHVREARFLFLKLGLQTTLRMPLGVPEVTIEDRVTNLSATPAEFQLLYHINLGHPILDGGARFIAPASTIVPRDARAAEGVANWNDFTAEQPGYVEQVYYCQLLAGSDHRTEVLLQNAHATQGFGLEYDVRQLPCLSLWKNTAASDDGYVAGIEPGTNYPNPRSFEGRQGRVVRLGPREEFAFDLKMKFHADEAAVGQARQRVEQLASTPPRIFTEPQPGWCVL